jgi:hypothetical protein
MSVSPQETPTYNREELYKELGLEDLLKDTPPPTDPIGRLVVDDRYDSFGNSLTLVWDPGEQAAHLVVQGIDILSTSGDQAAEALKHPYSFMARAIGEAALDDLLAVSPQAA